ncbi:MAG: response regulator [Armatimonadetes bacterium]|nr:response regulator [Armatimonadota bacterium]MDI9583181.1 response regulator [Acidobacteriota bacterium]
MPLLRVLVVDDEKALLAILQRALNLMGCDMVGACTLRDGLRLALSEDFDIILLDNHFPEGHCDAIVPSMVASKPDTPIVIITANPSDAHVANAMRHGVRQVISKPFTLEQLADALERYTGLIIRTPQAAAGVA